ncbi:MAG: phage major capsid protein [Pseudomonadota bacterium]|nr:phage major capsid protein [Pseudomonadota bacterium]MDE3038448.1 phage major capsid protein [Pseudomonadota bacterium]
MIKINELLQQRARAFDDFKALAEKPLLTEAEQAEYETKKRAVTDLDAQIARAKDAQALSAGSAQPVAGQDTPENKAPATVDADRYVKERSLVIGAAAKMMAYGGGNLFSARQAAIEVYGERHPVTRALVASTGPAGGFILPPDYMNEIIELLRPAAVVRGSNPRVIPMPRGTMTLPGQASPATASYGTEGSQIASSQQTLKQIVASFKKLTALVPISNDLMRYADPAIDAMVRDDLVEVIALREDLAFLLGDGTQAAPMGFTGFANAWAVSQGGTAGVWSATADSTAAVNGSAGNPLLGQNGGNFITSNESYSETTVVNELTGMINRLDTGNVPDRRRVWFMHPRTYNYLFGLLNSLGLYVFRDELSRGTLYGYPFKKTTQIPINIWDASGTNKDCSFIILAEMNETMILDSMSLELAVSREGTYTDANGNTVSAFQYDQTLIRAITEHDFQLRHDSGCSVLQFVRWAPAVQ